MKTNYSKWLFAGAIASVVAAFLTLSVIDKNDLYNYYKHNTVSKNTTNTTTQLPATQTAALSNVIIADQEKDKRFSGAFVIEWDDVPSVTITAFGKDDTSVPDVSHIALQPQGDTLTIDISQALVGNRNYYRGDITITLPKTIESLTIGSPSLRGSYYSTPQLVGKKAPERLRINNAGRLVMRGDFHQVSMEQSRASCMECEYQLKDAQFTQLSITGRAVSINLGQQTKIESLQLQTDSNSKLHLDNIGLLPRIQWNKTP